MRRAFASIRADPRPVAALQALVLPPLRTRRTTSALYSAGAITLVTLHPDVRVAGAKQPTADDMAAMHHQAHAQCFIANSVKTDVCCEPVGMDGGDVSNGDDER